ncbi:MAG: ABC transporter ATP-binding protein [Anaerorhabdus sp.]
MKKIFKYSKVYWFSIFLIVLFVFAQVQSELALPDYMSNIVTNGIQFSGIEEGVPSAISSETYNKLVKVLDESVMGNYQLIKKGDSDFIEEYPLLKNNDIYLLNGELDQNQSKEISKAMVIVEMLSMQEGSIEMLDDPIKKEFILEEADKQLVNYTDENISGALRLINKKEKESLGQDIAKIQSNYIYKEGFIMLAIALIGAVFAMLGAYLSSTTAGKIARDIRAAVFKKVESFSSVEFGKYSSSSLITRTTNDVQQVQMVLTMVFRMVLFAPLMGIGALLKVFRYPSMLWVLGLVVGILFVLLVITFLIAYPKFKIVQSLIDKINLVVKEYLSGTLVIRAFNMQKSEEERFDLANKNITKVNLFIARVMSSLMPMMMFLMNASALLILWVGASNIDAGVMQIGEMMAFLQYATQVLMSFFVISFIAVILPRSAVSIRRISEVLDTDVSIVDASDPCEFKEEIQPIIFDNVSFIYPNAEEYVLKDISFKANPNETVAFIGSTGSGKSTLVNLIPRFFEVSSGRILFGDTDIRKFRQSDLRERIGYVPQKGVLFSGDIESNLRYGDQDATDEAINDAIRVSQAKEFVDNKEDGVKSSIAQSGTNVSGGQKQRLSIARAIVKDPDIYIFDDSFSALDYKTDAMLRGALNENIKGKNKIVFIVAQRVSTITNADKIIVLDEGNVVGCGKHDELLENCIVYQEIVASQNSKGNNL